MSQTVFISYSHKDTRWKDRLVDQLGVLAQEGLLETWHDGLIQAGADWLPAIEAAMASARVAVLIISADFLNSEFILRSEIPTLLERRARQGLRVIPVVARPCQWQKVAWLAAIQARPLDGKTLAGLSTVKAEEVLSSLAGEILELVLGTAALHDAVTGPSPALTPFAPPAVPPVSPVQLGVPGVEKVTSRRLVRGWKMSLWTGAIVLLGILGFLAIRARRVWESGVYLRVPVHAHTRLTASMLEAVKGKAPKTYGPEPDQIRLVDGACVQSDLEKGHRLVMGDFESCEPEAPASAKPSVPPR